MTEETQMTICWWSTFIPVSILYLCTFIRRRRQKRLRHLVDYIFWYNQTPQRVVKELRVMKQFNQTYVCLSEIGL